VLRVCAVLVGWHDNKQHATHNRGCFRAQAAAAGNAEAQYRLGCLLEEGAESVAQDRSRAVQVRTQRIMLM
jgi:TPR repeat protein